MGTGIGQRIRETRIARGLTLEDVQHRTRIPCARLTELESDDCANFANLASRAEFLQGPDLPVLEAQPVESMQSSKRRPREEVRRAAQSAPWPTAAAHALNGRRP
jgi:hypothetical protein